jgi:Cytochrome c554 and c-prime
MPSKRSVIFSLALILFAVIMVCYVRMSRAQWPGLTPGAAALQGRVISPFGPVKDARVRVRGSEQFVQTDDQGRFVLPTSHLPSGRVVITAGKEGWFNNGEVSFSSGRTKDLFLNPVYLNDQSAYRFISPVFCARCHVNVTRYWDRSKMAHTTSNPKVLQVYRGTDAFDRKGIGPGYQLDDPGESGNCIACHAPSADVSRSGPRDVSAALRWPLSEWDGISCDYCHKVRKVVPERTRPSGMRALLERQTPARGSSVLEFGPYDDVVVPPMAASYNPLLEEGRFCSTCHAHFKKLPNGSSWDHEKVYTDREWAGFDLKDDTQLPIQTTYYEWKQWQDALSPGDPNKGKKCQDCHMSWRKEMLPYDEYVVDGGARNMWGTRRDPKNIHPHHFEGGTETQLKTALSMEMAGEIKGKRLNLKVYITNTNGGHWIPTGEPLRSVMLVLKAADSKGQPLRLVEGGTLPEWTGQGGPLKTNYAGSPGAVFAKVLGDSEGHIHVPFWRATRIAMDTRIRPKNTRELKFEFELNDPDDEPTAESRLIYRPVIQPWAEKKGWPTEDILITSQAW